MTKIQPVRGTHDLLPAEFAKFFAIQNIAREIAKIYGFAEMATPIFEFTEVFSRSMGETSDVVSKEMYSFKDRGDESITLRPEFTAGIVRAFISNGLQQQLPLKLFSTGAVFRYERPQKGRQRQFHQINFEWLGANPPYSDAEIILMAAELLKTLGITAQLQINSLGCKQSRENYRAELLEYFGKYQNELSEDSKIRLLKNPLRILDSKDENDIKINENAPKLADSLLPQAKNNFDNILNLLSANNLTAIVNSNLVRGLDYYNDIVFEFTSDNLGAQNTVLAGGRYDSLVSSMGGSDVPAVGWGAGLERLMLLSNVAAQKPELALVIAGDESLKPQAFKFMQSLRGKLVAAELANQTNIGKALKYANKIGANKAYILGEEEAKLGVVLLKNLETGEQLQLPI